MATSCTPKHVNVSSDPTHVESVQQFGWYQYQELQKLVKSCSSCKSLHVHVKCMHRRMVREGEGRGIEYMLMWCLVRYFGPTSFFFCCCSPYFPYVLTYLHFLLCSSVCPPQKLIFWLLHTLLQSSVFISFYWSCITKQLAMLTLSNDCIYFCMQTDDALSIYLEYVSGGSIHKLLREYGPFKEPVIRNYTGQILSGLAYLHGRNTVHRQYWLSKILIPWI